MAALAAVAGLVKLVTKLADRGPSAIDRPFLSTFHHGHEEEEEYTVSLRLRTAESNSFGSNSGSSRTQPHRFVMGERKVVDLSGRDTSRQQPQGVRQPMRMAPGCTPVLGGRSKVLRDGRYSGTVRLSCYY